MTRVHLAPPYRSTGRYPAAVVNITNRCNLRCAHCFVFRAGNPNAAPRRMRDEIDDEDVLETLAALRDRHGIRHVLFMGGEPLLRKRLLARATGLFPGSTVTTNGTVPLVDFGPSVLYVVSLDGPEAINDSIRGAGVYRRAIRNLRRIPRDFESRVQVQCTATRRNWRHLEELVAAVRETRAAWMTFSFYVARRGDRGPDAWPDNRARAEAVGEVLRLRERYPGFIRNSRRSLELMLPPHAARVTADCPAVRHILPLYQEDGEFRTPFCCYGNDVDCERCGAWAVFHLAARMEARARDRSESPPQEGSEAG